MIYAQQKLNLVVLGAGSWGAALAHQARLSGLAKITLLARSEADCLALANGTIRQLPACDAIPPLMATTDPSILAKAELILLAAPLSAHQTACEQINKYAPQKAAIIFCSKGLVADSEKGGLFLPEYAQTALAGRPIAMLTGPSFADEVLANLPTALLIASPNQTLCGQIADIFEPSHLRIYQGDDMMGAAIGGAAKNVIAIAAGIVAGMGFGDNARAALVTRGLAEITRFAIQAGGQPKTISGLAGLGDLILSCASNHSRNMAYGFHIGAGTHPDGRLSEGRHAVAHLVARARYHAIDMPISEAVDAIINQGAPIEHTITQIMARKAFTE